MHLFNIDIEEEMVTFLCSVIAFFILVAFRNNKVLTCWRQLKNFHQSSIHLPMIVRAMRFCNKGGYFIVTELKVFFNAHPQECSIGLVNDLLEPLARRSDDAQLVDLLEKMITSINLTKDSRTYEIMLTMHATNGNLAKTQSVMAEMNISEVTFTPRATVAVMTMGLQTGNADVVLKALIKLKPSWDDRSTWSVSMFALERHKTNVLMQVVTLASQKGKMMELSAALNGMTVPEEVSSALQSKLSLLSDTDLAAFIEVLEKSGSSLEADPIYNTLISYSRSRSLIANLKSLPAWTAKKEKFEHADSSASTSDGSRSDSEGESPTSRTSSIGHCIRAPRGVVGF